MADTYSYGSCFDDSELVAGIDDGGGYDWEEIQVRRRLSDGELRWGHGSGCSCNSFEDMFGSFDDFHKLPETWYDLELAAHSMSCGAANRIEFLVKVKELMKCPSLQTISH